jgi:hypothetical protein
LTGICLCAAGSCHEDIEGGATTQVLGVHACAGMLAGLLRRYRPPSQAELQPLEVRRSMVSMVSMVHGIHPPSCAAREPDWNYPV